MLLIALLTGALGKLDLSAQTPEKVELIQADSAHYDEQKGKYIQMLMGNVKLKHGNAIMSCDRANLDNEENTFEAFGNVHIFQADTINIRGKHLLYNGNTKIAIIDGDVVLIDEDMVLRTNAITYNTETRNGYYATGGVLTSGSDRLTSRVGTYNGYSKVVGFRDNVVLTNPEYSMKGDTLVYGTVSKKAWFYGPTVIESKEDKIFCNRGWYNTRSKKAAFSQRAKIFSGTNTIEGDSLQYDRNLGVGEAFGNIVVEDTLEEILVFGEYGFSNQKTDRTLVTGNTWAKKYLEKDSMYIKADSFFYFKDSIGKNLSAYRNTQIFKSDMQSSCDSFVYRVADSVMCLHYLPILWTDANQITGKYMEISIKNNQVHRLDVDQKAFVLSKEAEDKFNQLSGKQVVGFFEGSALKNVKVIGNGRSIYYAAEDSVNYTGVNKIECSEMLIKLDSNKVKDILFYTKPTGTFYPLKDFPSGERRLPGFRNYADKRPKLSDFITEEEVDPVQEPEADK